METFKIVVPVDLSEHDTPVIDFLVSQISHPVSFYLFHQMHYPVLPGAYIDVTGTLAELYIQMHKQAEASMDKLMEGFLAKGIDIRAEVIQETGTPIGKALSDYAQKVGADLVVLHSRHRRGMDALFEGSNLLSIVRNSANPMLILSTEKSMPIHRIGFATDFSPESADALIPIRKIARYLGAGLLCYRVNTLDEFKDDRTFVQERIQFMNTAAGGDLPEIKQYNAWNLEDGILMAAEDFLADTIALSTHGRTGLSRLFNGSISERIIRSTTQPLLVIPQKGLA